MPELFENKLVLNQKHSASFWLTAELHLKAHQSCVTSHE